MRYKEIIEASWSQRIGGPPTTGGDRELAQSQQLIQQAQQAYQQQFGKPLQINSTHRTRERQQDLYTRSRRGERGVYVAADPSKSPDAKYFHLFSMDISNLNRQEQALLKKLGWTRPDPVRDPVHYQYAGTVQPADITAQTQAPTAQTQAPTAQTKPSMGGVGDLMAQHLKDIGLV